MNRARKRPAVAETPATAVRQVHRATACGWLPMIAGMICFYVALPPGNLWPLAWIAPLGWLLTISRTQLPGHRPYVSLWMFGGLYWMIVLQGVRLAHWANYFGLLALGFYFGACWPLFIGSARTLFHRWHIPLPLSASLAWASVEWLRSQGPVGFTCGMLAHTQVHQPLLIQVSDLFGGYTLSWIMVFVCGALFRAWSLRSRPRRAAAWVGLSVLTACGLVAYGINRIEPPQHLAGSRNRPPLRVALIQGSIDTEFTNDPTRGERMLREYADLTYQAVGRSDELDLVIWPESMFPFDGVVFETSGDPGPGYDRSRLESLKVNFDRMIENLARGINEQARSRRSSDTSRANNRGISMILGVGFWHFDGRQPRHYNSAILVAPDGRIVARYDKTHPVLFGEYVPLGDWFPWLYALTPMSSGLTPGDGPIAFEVEGTRLAPSICFESILPQLIRRHVEELNASNQAPDALVNITNDGWFWGSSILDLQMNCGVFRAVEMRRPMLISANTGISAVIDGSGRILQRGPRRQRAVLTADVPLDGRRSLYLTTGDIPWMVTMFIILLATVAARLNPETPDHGKLATPH